MLTQQANAPDIKQYLDALSKKKQQQHTSHRIWCRLQPGQWIGREVKIAIIYVRITETIG